MRGFTLESGKTIYLIRMLNLSHTLPHEETIPELVESLANNISSSGIQRHPIIIDKQSLMILDGMHRAEALRMIGCSRVLSCLVEYHRPEIMVKRWFRTIKGSGFERGLKDVLSNLRLKTYKLSLRETVKLMDDGRGVCALISPKTCYVIEGDDDSFEHTFNVIKKLEVELSKRYGGIAFETEMDSLKSLKEGIISGVLAIPRIKKEDLIRSSRKGYLLPRKTTRHIIPTRPLEVDVPLSLLMGKDESLEEANSELIELLESKSIERISSGTIVEGRKYEEELIIFKDNK